ncbi:methylamine utilization protein [Sphingomonas panacisoli]|nr:methylamine utilization protein [Sphingomonas panacisoli]
MIEMARPPAGPIKFPWPYVMAQQNIAFVPHVLIVPVGATVSFPNRDKVRHHVYSFSGAKKFDMKLYGRDETRAVTFDKEGVVTLGCNIHDAMSAFIIVVDTPFAAQTDTSGRVTIANVPVGAATIRVWYPSARAPENMLTQPAAVTATGLDATYTIRPR